MYKMSQYIKNDSTPQHPSQKKNEILLSAVSSLEALMNI